MNRNGKINARSKVLLVDDDPAVLAALAAALGKHFEVAARCTSGEEALKVMTTMPVERRPDLVLLDIKMPGRGGIACCRELRKLFPNLLIAMHTAMAVQERFEEARVAGADAYLVKGVATENLAMTLQHLERRAGHCLCVADVGTKRVLTNELNPLTNREMEVMDFISLGWGYKQAAHHFGCSESNIKKTVARAIRHLAARSRDHAIRLWLEGVRSVPKDIFSRPDNSATNSTNP
jgi:DNA-binding NarL/FixJ family response regulator